MTLITADRVKDTTATTGTGSLALSGVPPAGFRAFSSVMATSDTCYYCIASPGGAEWEVGVGTLTASTTLARTTVLASSNAGSLVSLSAGSKDVFITAPAAVIQPGAWTAFTPTISQSGATVAYGTRQAAYERIGNTVRARFIIPLAAGTSGGGAQPIFIQNTMLPAQKITTVSATVGYFNATNGTTTNWAGTIVVASSTDWGMISTGSGGYFGQVPNVALISTFSLTGTLEYEAA